MKELSRIASAVQASTTMAIDAMFKQMKADGVDVIGFGAGEPDFNTPDNIRAAGIAAIEQNITRYTPAAGTVELRQAVCGRMKADYGLEYKPSQVVVSSGAKHLVYLALRAVVNPGDEVILPAPYWVSYIELIKMVGGVPVVVTATEAEHFKLTAEKLSAAITPRTKAILLNNPSNPTGMMYDREELEAIAAVCTQADIYVISDEIYACLAYDGRTFTSFASLSADAKERTILVNGVSKAYAMTGWRIGYLLAPAQVIEQIGKSAENLHSSVNSLSQYAGIAAMLGSQEMVEQIRQEYIAKRQIVVNALAGSPVLRLVEPEGAFYAFVDVRGTGLDSDDFSRRLLDEQRVAVVPGEAFGEEGRGFVRLSYAGDADELREGLRRLRTFAEQI